MNYWPDRSLLCIDGLRRVSGCCGAPPPCILFLYISFLVSGVISMRSSDAVCSAGAKVLDCGYCAARSYWSVFNGKPSTLRPPSCITCGVFPLFRRLVIIRF